MIFETRALTGRPHEKVIAFKRQCRICQAISIVRRRNWSDRWRATLGGGKNTVEGCRSIDVLEWHRRGYFRSPRWFSWAWTRDGERVASINVETQRHSVTLKYRSRSYGEDWSDVEQRVAIEWKPCRFGGERPWFVCSVAANGVYCGRRATKLYGAGGCSHAVTAIGLSMRASRNRPISAGLGNHKRSECGWAEARTCLRSFPTSRKACTGGPTSDGVASMMPPKSGQPLA